MSNPSGPREAVSVTQFTGTQSPEGKFSLYYAIFLAGILETIGSNSLILQRRKLRPEKVKPFAFLLDTQEATVGIICFWGKLAGA